MTEKDLQRFWSKVSGTEIANSCWIWIAKNKQRGGYGKFSFGGREYGAHRVAWMIKNGAIPEGMHVLHNCPIKDNPACVNPAHLWLGKWLENNHDTAAKGRRVEGDHRGEKSGVNKITADDVRVIRCLRALGFKLTEIGDLYGIHFSTVGHIFHRRLWPHVD
jgi:HNH endonuclease